MKKVTVELTPLEIFYINKFLKRKKAKIIWLGFGKGWIVQGEELRVFRSYWEARRFRIIYM